MLRVLLPCLLFAIVLCLAGTNHSPSATPPGRQQTHAAKVVRSASIMGTEFVVEMYGQNPDLLRRASDDALAEGNRINRMLSNYLADSELSYVNASAAKQPVKISPELFRLISYCQRISSESEGSFDITVGQLMKTWGFFKDSGHLPDPAAIRQTLQKVGYARVELNPQADTVRFRTAGVELDPGGVGKGYAVDRMVAVLRREHVTSALVSAGGSSVYGLGTPAGSASGWRLHIRDPQNDRKTVADVYLKNMSLSTSGSYEKFFWADDKVYSHIMDPRTGYPAHGMLAVSVVSPLTLDSEVWAKPYFILGAKWALQHKPPLFRVFVCPDKPAAACAWLP